MVQKIILAGGLAVGIILIGLGTFVFSGFDISGFRGLIGLSLIDVENARLVCDDTNCTWHFRSVNPSNTGGILSESINLDIVDTSAPILVTWQVLTVSESDACKTFAKNIRMEIKVNDKDIKTVSGVDGAKTVTDIQPFVKGMTGELEIGMGGSFCTVDLAGVNYQISNGEGSSPKITFAKFGKAQTLDEVLEEMIGDNQTKPEPIPLPQPKEILCVEIFQPVCGIDGVTYSNACFAESAETDIAHDGECTFAEMQAGEAQRQQSTTQEEDLIKTTTTTTQQPRTFQIEFGLASQVFMVAGVVVIIGVVIGIMMRKRNRF